MKTIFQRNVWLAAVAAAIASLTCASAAAVDDPDLIFAASMEPFVILRGKAVYPAPLVGATVTARVGGSSSGDFVYTATTNSDGSYSITVPIFDEQRVPTLGVRGTGAQAHIEYATTPGSLGALQDLADTNLVLTAVVEPYLDLNPFTTGVYAAMRAVIGGAGVRMAPEFTRAARGHYVLDAYRRGYLNALIASGDIALPAGASTSLAAMLDVNQAAAVQDAADALGACPNAACTAREALLSDPTIVPILEPVTRTELQSHLTFSPSNNIGGLRFHLLTNGNGRIARQSDNHLIAWTPEGYVAATVRQDGAPFQTLESFPARQCEPGAPVAQVRERVEVLKILLRFVRGPARGYLVQAGEQRRTSYPDLPGSTLCVARLEEFWNVGFSTLPTDAVPYAFANPSGTTRLLPICATTCTVDTPEISGPIALEPHTFAANGTGTLSRVARTFTWNLDTEGRLQLLYSNGAAGQFTRVSEETPDYGHVIVRYQDSNGVTYGLDGSTMLKDPAFQFTPTTVAGSYDTLINKDHPFSFVVPFFGPMFFGFTFYEDGTGRRFQTGSTTGPFVRWSILTPASRFQFDQFANSTSNTVLQRRTWELIRLSAAGDVYYLLENIPTPASAPPTFAPTRRLVGYRKTVNPPIP